MSIIGKNDRESRADRRQRKKRERERRKRRVYRFGRKELKHAKRGILSCMLAAVSVFLLMSVFSLSYIRRGDVNILIGFIGLIAFVTAGFGLARGIEGLKERNKNYNSCKLGIVCNGILLLAYAATFIRGLL